MVIRLCTNNNGGKISPPFPLSLSNSCNELQCVNHDRNRILKTEFKVIRKVVSGMKTLLPNILFS